MASFRGRKDLLEFGAWLFLAHEIAVTEETRFNDCMNSSESVKPKRRWRRILAALATTMLLVLIFLPVVIARTSLRDEVLTLIAAAPGYQISTRGASFGWLTPLSIQELTITDPDRASSVKVASLVFEKSPLQLWLSSPDLGTVKVENPVVVVKLPKQDPDVDRESENSPVPNLTAVVRNGSLRVWQDDRVQPVIDVEDVDLTMHLRRETPVSFLVIDQLEIFDHEELTAEVANKGLQLLVPELVNELSIEGQFSLRLHEIQLPLCSDENQFAELVQVAGRLQFHQVSAGIIDSRTQRLVAMFAEMLSLDQPPERWRLSDLAEVKFHVNHGKVAHESLARLLPEIGENFAIRTEGTVSIDDQLDLLVSVQLPVEILGNSELANRVSQIPIVISLFGPAADPKYGLPDDPKWVIQLSDDLLSPTLNQEEQELADSILKFIGLMAKELPNAAQVLPANLMQRLNQLESKK